MNTKVNDLMEEFREETRYIDSDGKLITLREAIDNVLGKDGDKKRKLGVDA